ncbi:MAG: hypothetical protein AAF995_08850, partial [Planctomycetota bacterium]
PTLDSKLGAACSRIAQRTVQRKMQVWAERVAQPPHRLILGGLATLAIIHSEYDQDLESGYTHDVCDLLAVRFTTALSAQNARPGRPPRR